MRRPSPELAGRLRAAADRILAPDRTASIDEAAALTGVARTTLYYYFGGPDDLTDFLLLDKVDRIGERMAAAAEGEGTPAHRLTAVLTAAVEAVAAHPVLCTTLVARLAVLPDGHPLGAAVERAVMRPLQRLLADGDRAGAFAVDDPEVAASALYGGVSMAALSTFARDGAVDARRLAGALVPQLVASVRAPAPAGP
jgi:TetR/AcrR family transcriptional regulator